MMFLDGGERAAQVELTRQNQIYSVAPVRLCDPLVPRRLGSATTKRSGDSYEIEPVIPGGY
jgi:hypothetical protein